MIREVSDALVDVIHQATPDLGTWVLLHSLSLADAAPQENRLAVALYAIEEHPHLRNRPLVSSPGGYVRPPLALRLRYLMSYIGSHDEAQARLSRIVAVFHTTPIIDGTQLPPALAAEVENLTIRLVAPDADERNQIWGALGRHARLALFYEVDVAPIDLLTSDGAETIRSHRINFVGAP